MSGVFLTSRRKKTILPCLTSWLDRAAETEKKNKNNTAITNSCLNTLITTERHEQPIHNNNNKTNQCSSSAAGDVMFHFSSFNKSAVNAFLRLYSCFQLDQGVQCVCVCLFYSAMLQTFLKSGDNCPVSEYSGFEFYRRSAITTQT